MLLEHERYYGWVMGALVTVCSWNTNVSYSCLGIGALERMGDAEASHLQQRQAVIILEHDSANRRNE